MPSAMKTTPPEEAPFGPASPPPAIATSLTSGKFQPMINPRKGTPMHQQILCRCTLNSDLLIFKCIRGHCGLLCGHCMRTGCVSECPVCFSRLTVEVSELRRSGKSPSRTHQALQ